MVIKNGNVLSGNFEFIKTDIEFTDKIISVAPSDAKEFFDATDCYVIPGFVDTHMHGAMGENFLDFTEKSADKVCTFEASMGTTSLVPAISAAPEDKMTRAVKYITDKAKNQPLNQAKLMGIHLEGPFFSPEFKGAHHPRNIRNPDTEEFDRLWEAGEGMVKIITMAPELENGYDTVSHIAGRGVTVSVGHTNATCEEAKKAFSLGASQTTHTFNAMTGLHHRKAGVVGAAMSSPDICCELICDFFHVDPTVVGILYGIKGCDKITMITDSELGTGMPDGEYEVNGQKLIVKDRKTYLESGTIAGGSSVMLDGVKNLVSIGIPLEETVKCATINGAKAAKIDSRVGSLDVGKDADILVLDKELRIKEIFINGKMLGM